MQKQPVAVWWRWSRVLEAGSFRSTREAHEGQWCHFCMYCIVLKGSLEEDSRRHGWLTLEWTPTLHAMNPKGIPKESCSFGLNAWWVICLFRLWAARLAAHACTDGRYPQHFTTRLQCNNTRQAWKLVAGNTEFRKVKAIFLPGSTYEHPIPCWRLKEPFEGIYTKSSKFPIRTPSITLCHTLGHCGYYQAPRFGSVEAVICTSWATAIWACWVLMALNSTCSTYRIQATDVMQPRYVCNFVQVRPHQWNELCFRAVPKKYVASLWRQVAGTMAFAFAEAMDRLGVDLQTFLSQSYELQTSKEVTQVTRDSKSMRLLPNCQQSAATKSLQLA